MKKLLTLLLLVISLLASGQSDSQSLETEIKYWKSIAESDDTVAYREYLQRYGEDGLYKDEALTRIALLKTSGKQAQSINTECCFYSQYGPKSVEYVVRFDAEHSKLWLKPINYDTVRSNLAISRDYYENQATIGLSRELYKKVKKCPIIGEITVNNVKDLTSVYITATRSCNNIQYKLEYDGYSGGTTKFYYDFSLLSSHNSSLYKNDNNNFNYYLSIPPGSYKIQYKIYDRSGHSKTVVVEDIIATSDETKIINAVPVLDKKSIGQVIVAGTIPHHKNAWTTDEEYQYDPMKSTSARDVFVKRDNSGTMQGYRYVAFSKDKSSYITWFEQDNNLDGVIYGKRNYYSVPKKEFLPKAVNYDFLNE